jgi:hypothetical protein
MKKFLSLVVFVLIIFVLDAQDALPGNDGWINRINMIETRDCIDSVTCYTEVMHNFTLYTLNGTFSSESGLSSIELGGNKQAFNEPWGTILFELPANLVKQWKFTRISLEQLSRATT